MQKINEKEIELIAKDEVFKPVNINHKSFKDRTGEISCNKQGERMQIIRYGWAKDIDVLFDDGYIACNKEYQSFKKKEIRNLNTFKPPTGKRFDRTGEETTNKQGLLMRILNYRMANDFDVIFEDNTIVQNKTYEQFRDGTIFNNNYQYVNPNLIDRTGEIGVNTDGQQMKIVKYNSYHDIDVEFEDGFIYRKADFGNFKLGNIKNPFYRSLFGIGYHGDIKKNDSHKRSYRVWIGMLNRCYYEKFQVEYPTYIGCTVCDEWHCYTDFEKWYNENYYKLESEEVHIDKDWLIKGNKLYSPDTCIFVPEYINNLIIKRHRIKDNLPIGVHITKQGRYYSDICNYRERKRLGTFSTVEEAFNSYKQAKENHIKNVADKYKDKIPQKLYEAMYAYKVEITD